MQLEISTIKTLRKKDVDSDIRYSFDEALEYVIKKNCKTQFNIIEFTQKMLNDFGLFNVNIIKSDKKYSYAGGFTTSIAYAQKIIDTGCIETAIHEFSHIVAQYIFDIPTGHFHDSFFASILKFFLIKYEILTTEQIDYAQKISHTTLSDSALIKLESTNHNTAYSFIQSLGLTHNSNNIFEHTDYTLNIKYRIIFSQNNVAVITVRKLYGFEFNQSIFSELSNDELSHFVLISPNALLNDKGEVITNHYYGTAGFIQYSVNQNKLTFSFDLAENKKQTTMIINNIVKELKLNKIKYKRTTTMNEFNSLTKQLKEELQQRVF